MGFWLKRDHNITVTNYQGFFWNQNWESKWEMLGTPVTFHEKNTGLFKFYSSLMQSMLEPPSFPLCPSTPKTFEGCLEMPKWKIVNV
jgi:hypothetical protein